MFIHQESCKVFLKNCAGHWATRITRIQVALGHQDSQNQISSINSVFPDRLTNRIELMKHFHWRGRSVQLWNHLSWGGRPRV